LIRARFFTVDSFYLLFYFILNFLNIVEWLLKWVYHRCINLVFLKQMIILFFLLIFSCVIFGYFLANLTLRWMLGTILIFLLIVHLFMALMNNRFSLMVCISQLIRLSSINWKMRLWLVLMSSGIFLNLKRLSTDTFKLFGSINRQVLLKIFFQRKHMFLHLFVTIL